MDFTFKLNKDPGLLTYLKLLWDTHCTIDSPLPQMAQSPCGYLQVLPHACALLGSFLLMNIQLADRGIFCTMGQVLPGEELAQEGNEEGEERDQSLVVA